MEALTLDKAMELYEILGVHIPEIQDKNADAFDFVGKIIDNINASDDHQAYTLAIELMTRATLSDLQELSSESRLDLFAEGLMQNRILDLKSFCDRVGL
jgi:hypothetical protein